MRSGCWLIVLAGVAMAVVLRAGGPPPAKAEVQRTASLREAICRMVDAAAESNGLPASFLTRVLWQESGFRTDVTRPVGAPGLLHFCRRRRWSAVLPIRTIPARRASRPPGCSPNSPAGLAISGSLPLATTPAPA